jgi:hypothetical protein
MKMISTMALLLATFCLFTAGCSKADTTTTPSGKGFELKDVGDQTVKQTDSDSVKVSVDRKGGWDGEVTIDISGLPAGVTVDGPKPYKILANDSAVTLKLMASDMAAPTEKHQVMIKASANVEGQNLSKSDNFNLTVKPK